MPKSNGGEDHIIEEKKFQSINITPQENQRTQVSTKGCDEPENAKAEIGEIRQENQRLKMVLQHIEKGYQSLQLRFFDIVKQEDPKKLATDHNSASIKHVLDHQTKEEEADLVSLSLGRSPRSSEANKNINIVQDHDHDRNHDDLKANLTLGLGSEMQLSSEVVTAPSPENGTSEELKEKSQKTLVRNGDDEVSHEQPPVKRARVSVRVRCDTPTMNDGCQWRKYGQKIAKGNPCPRAYYRCTVAPCCPVRKQVQRCAEDMSILITTYEGTHNHPLPVTATAMASTTLAAASMLLSGSSTSSDHPTTNSDSTKDALTMLNGLNYGHFDTMRAKPFYLPNSTISSSSLFPTITLDLTSSPISSSSSSSSSSPPYPFNRLSLPSGLARIPSLSLNFGNSSSGPNVLPTLWGNGSYLAYGNTMLMPHHKSQIGSLNLEKQANPVHESLTETLTKAIMSDPGAFKSVIAAAISSMVGGRESTLNEKQDGVKRIGQGLTLGEQNGKGLASSSFNRLSSSNF